MRFALACILVAALAGELSAQASIRLRVVDLHGGPVTAFSWTLRRNTVGSSFGSEPKPLTGCVAARDVDLEGVLIRDLPCGSYSVKVEAPGFARWWVPDFSAQAGQVTEVVVPMSRGGTIRGRVVDEEAHPVAGAKITAVSLGEAMGVSPDTWGEGFFVICTDASTMSATDGTFELRGLDYGIHSFRVHHATLCDATASAKIEAHVVVDAGTVRLVKGATVRGRLPTYDRHTEVVRVVQDERAVRSPRLAFPVASDREGRFTLSQRLPPARYELRIDSRDAEQTLFCITSAPLRVHVFEVVDGQEEVDLGNCFGDASEPVRPARESSLVPR